MQTVTQLETLTRSVEAVLRDRAELVDEIPLGGVFEMTVGDLRRIHRVLAMRLDEEREHRTNTSLSGGQP